MLDWAKVWYTREDCEQYGGWCWRWGFFTGGIAGAATCALLVLIAIVNGY